MENRKLSFEVDASSIDIKQLLQKDFLELSMRVISDANPNVNKSWFTVESMEKSLHTFANKPILGYFENGDFVSHDGEWNYDSETEMSYWDTLGKKGERILGLIRESDEVKIVKGKDDLNWIELKCCLWVQYSYKQVKRLIKDAKKAQKNGGLAKNVSVEIEVLDSETMPNGVEKINEFNLIGVTILGSRNGVKVEPGIENAGLSVIDIMGKDVFARQEKSVRLAYERLDGPNTKKEEFSNMDNEIKAPETVSETQEVKEEQTVTEEQKQFSSENSDPAQAPVTNVETEEGKNAEDPVEDVKTFEEVCPECGQNPCVCEEKKKEEEKKECDEDEDDEGKDGEDKDGKEDDNCKFEGEAQQEVQAAEVCPGCAADMVYDLSYMLRQTVDFATSIAYTLKFYEEYAGEKESLIALLNRMKRQNAEDAATLSGLLNEATEEFKNSVIKFENEVSEDTMSSLYNKYSETKAKNDELAAKFAEIEKKEFLDSAKELIDSVGLSEEVSKSLFEACSQDEITNLEDLKIKVALKTFEEKVESNKNNKQEKKEEVLSFNAPVINPDTTTVFDNKKKEKATSSWDVLRDINSK